MKYIVIGLFFVLFSYPLTFLNFSSVFGIPTIDLIPSFVGYGLITKGLKELEPISTKFRKIIPWVRLMIVVSAVIWGMNILGVGDGYTGSIASFCVKPVEYYIMYNIIRGIKEIEDYYQTDLCTRKLKKIWWGITISALLFFFSIFGGPFLIALMLISGLIYFINTVRFVICVDKTRRLYNKIPASIGNVCSEQNISNGDEI